MEFSIHAQDLQSRLVHVDSTGIMSLPRPPQPLEIRLSADMAAQEACYEACTECSLAFLRVFLLTLHLKIPGPQGSRSPGPSQKLRAMLALFLRH